METFNRYRLMLQTLPRFPKKIAVREIIDRLEAAGCSRVNERNIQRDLEKLSAVFPIISDNRKPKGWSWAEGGQIVNIPGMDPQTALTFRLVERFMLQMIPPSCLKFIEPHFRTAGNVLEKTHWDHLNVWPEKLVFLSRNQPLLAPDIPQKTLDVVYEALFTDKRFKAVYHPRGKAPAEYEVNPHGLVFVDSILYLVSTLWEYDDPVQLALHRIESIELTDKPVRKPEGFSLAGYVANHEFEYPAGKGSFRLEALFAAVACHHLQETPLAPDQTITAHKDGRMRIKATVSDTHQLRWWLLSFGSYVEVLRPKKLRDEIGQIAAEMVAQYEIK